MPHRLYLLGTIVLLNYHPPVLISSRAVLHSSNLKMLSEINSSGTATGTDSRSGNKKPHREIWHLVGIVVCYVLTMTLLSMDHMRGPRSWKDLTCPLLLGASCLNKNGQSAYLFGEVNHKENATKATVRNTTNTTKIKATQFHTSTEDKQCETIHEKVLPCTRVQNSTVMQGGLPYRETSLGNVMSLYWAARVVAELGGYNYLLTSSEEFRQEGSFLKFLPTFVSRKKDEARPDELQRFLCHCPTKLQYYHECHYGQSAIAETIRQDTQLALKKYASLRLPDTDNESHILGSFYKPNDWLIYDRCCLLGHQVHGFATLSFYNILPKNGTYTVYTLAGRREGQGEWLCDELHAIRNQHLSQRNPNITIIPLQQSTDKSIDFGRLVFAPNLMIPSAGSSWALWASLANSGRVVTVPNGPIQEEAEENPPGVPDNFEALTNATILYNPEFDKHSAELLGFDNATTTMADFVNTTQGKHAILGCFRHC